MSYGALAYLRRQYLCVLRRCAFLNAFSSWLLLAAPAAMAAQPPIVTDGRTATTLSQSGAVTDITTATVRGKNAFNSFSRFNIGSGQTVNLHLPQQTANLLNLVRNERSHIDGVMNAYKDGRIGGNVFFFNPHGMVV
ncbi:MAG: leukotoxin LktA family filamentous adhesin, partial [Rhodocyclaceae bacterium]|nr:leukotoxin LktA family filamentous adhesin [Rhodocyclaceae bacterium]